MPDSIDLEPEEFRGRRVFHLKNDDWKKARNGLPIPLVILAISYFSLDWPHPVYFFGPAVFGAIAGALLMLWLAHYD